MPVQTRSVKFVVTAENDGHCAARPRLRLQIRDERAPDALTLMTRFDRQRMQFNHLAVVLRNPANPADRIAIFVQCDAANAFRLKRFLHRSARLLQRVPCFRKMNERVAQNFRNLFDKFMLLGLELKDGHAVSISTRKTYVE
ncbi:MAG: hypothetical protein HDKAJFGB_01168 [Anaerolineae bacterium]|nr:hypothetical protein [Anaerolineae bacterium]